jgi:antitoxin (DNA-binding transcriptional repressor) of toxin-antitoxin stability system
MKYITARDLRSSTPDVWSALREEREIVVTLNGKPVAVMGSVEGEDVDEFLAVLSRARAMYAVDRLQEASRRAGKDKLTAEDVESEIAAVRRKRPK